MGRYIYLGPYTAIEIMDHGTKKMLVINEPADIEDDAFILDQMRRGFHMFKEAGDAPEPAAPEPEPEPEPAPEETPEEAPPA